MNKPIAPTIMKAPAIQGIQQGQNASLTLNPGKRVRAVTFLSQVTKTSPTADANFEPSLSDALGMISLLINDKSGKRDATAQEINEIQSGWSANLSARLRSKTDINGNAIADTTPVCNAVNCTARTSTWELTYHFAEPSRDSYNARRFFALPTKWVDAQGNITTAKVQFLIGVPEANTALAAMAAGVGDYNLSNPAMRAEIEADDVLGSFVGDQLVGGVWQTTPQSTNTPALPMTHWYRQSEDYNSTSPEIDDWKFVGYLQQQSIFSPSGSGDDVTDFKVKKDSQSTGNVTRFDSSKFSDDGRKLRYNWNAGRIGTGANDAAGTNWPQADVFHKAYDFDDDPMSAEEFAKGDTLELDLTLAQVTAGQKRLIIISQVYRDALAS